VIVGFNLAYTDYYYMRISDNIIKFPMAENNADILK